MAFVFERHPDMQDIVLVRADIFADDRGWFAEIYKRSAFVAGGIDAHFVQENRSLSARRGVLRGLHVQVAPHEQGKLIQCVAGAFFDVAVDVRPASASFSHWIGVELSAAEPRAMWIPPGFAHGALALTDAAELVYRTTAEYSPAHERTIRWNDPAIGIAWPIASPSLSARDASAPTLAEARPQLG